MRNVLTAIVLLIASLVTASGEEPVKREFRGAWIATIYGLDWPSAPATDAAGVKTQQKQLREILDRLNVAGLNVVMFQVRTFSDAIYRSNLEPWAGVLTGTRGQAPAIDWDPLKFCIDEAHARGMECHAWVNPFRYSTSIQPYADKFDAKMRPMLISFTEKPKSKRGKAKTTVILDPGNPAARKHVVDVCRDIVKRYDIDGMVFDDYFYPDRLPLGGGYDYNEWKKSGSSLAQDAWRRDNVNRTIAAVHEMIKKEKPYVTFGISPAGVGGGNGESSSRYGLPQCIGNDWMYSRLFCDPLAWMAAGTVDYISPQIYWNRDHETNPYGPIAEWWGKAAEKLGCHIYPSLSLSSFAKNGGDNPDAWAEREAQIDINRRICSSDAPGSIFYAARNINGFGKRLAADRYRYRALPPAFAPENASEPQPVSHLKLTGRKLTWRHPEPGMRFAVYAIPHDRNIIDAISVTYGGLSAEYLLGITYTNSYILPDHIDCDFRLSVAPIDRYGVEGEASFTD